MSSFSKQTNTGTPSVFSGIDVKNKGLLLLGIIFLIGGLIASFYHAYETDTIMQGTPYATTYTVDKGYPYQGIGAFLVVAGVVFLALAFLYPSQRRHATQEVQSAPQPVHATPVAPTVSYCPYCGTAREEGRPYCRKCGQKLP